MYKIYRKNIKYKLIKLLNLKKLLIKIRKKNKMIKLRKLPEKKLKL